MHHPASATPPLPIPFLSNKRHPSKFGWVDGLICLITERLINATHHGEHLFFLQAASHDLDTDWEAVHLFDIVELVHASRYTIQLAKLEVGGELVESLVHLRHGNSAGRIVKLYVGFRLSSGDEQYFQILPKAGKEKICGDRGDAAGK